MLIKSPTPHQTAIFDHVASEAGNLIVQAVAGSGKTSTIVHAMSLLGADEDAIYLVFNKRNQTEAEERLRGTRVKAMTFNALGFRALGRGWTLDTDKAKKCWIDMRDAGRMTEEEAEIFGVFVKRLVDLARSMGIGAIIEDTEDAWIALCNDHDLAPDSGRDDDDRDDNLLGRGVSLARTLLSYMLDVAYDHRVIDFADQLFLPIHPDFRAMCRLPRPDRIFVDEAQDLSPVQVELVAAMMGLKVGAVLSGEPEGQRVVFVGDRAQAIYGWRGAASDAMDRIKERFACDELPLTVCWRCDADIVDLAASIGVTEILSAPGKSRGAVEDFTSDAGEALKVNGWKGVEAKPGSVAICRTTAPLISAAYRIIRKGRRAVVLGREIGAGLVSLVKKICGKSIKPHASVDMIFDRLDAWVVREVQKAGDREDKAAAAQDRAECIRCVAEELPVDRYTIADLITQIESIFSDQQAAGGVTLCTIHKSKGLEWDEVTILDWHRLPSQWAKRAWQRQQERHCVYVAVTRARHRLVLCEAADFEPR